MTARSRRRHALVTGASSGIGAAVVHALASDGLHVTVVARRSIGIDMLRQRLAEDGLDCAVVSADLARTEGVAAVLGAIDVEHGPVDILVNNVGGAPMRPVLELTDADWAATIQKNLLTAVGLSAAIVPGMCERGWGRVVNVASIAAREPHVDLAHYSAAKAGLMAYAKALSKAVAKHGVTVNTVVPGVIETEGYDTHVTALAAEDGVDVEEARRRLTAREAGPSGRCGRPDEVASAVVFLIGDDAGYVNGASLVVDGGTLEGIF